MGKKVLKNFQVEHSKQFYWNKKKIQVYTILVNKFITAKTDFS